MARVLAADFGGTTTRLAIIDSETHKVLVREECETASVRSAEKILEEFSRGKQYSRIALAAAGPVVVVRGSRSITLSNAKLTLDEKKLSKAFGKPIVLLNDFEAIAHSIKQLKTRDKRVLRTGRRREGPIVILGAGTGFGKALLALDERTGRRVDVKSEFGHTDLPAQDEHELRFLEFVKHSLRASRVSYEHVLSGSGLELLYEFYAGTRAPAEVVVKGSDAHAREAIKDFVKFYARAARNAAVDDQAVGGVYLAGGVALKNPTLFGRLFVNEFCHHDRKEVARMLADLPLVILTNPDVALLGAAREALR